MLFSASWADFHQEIFYASVVCDHRFAEGKTWRQRRHELALGASDSHRLMACRLPFAWKGDLSRHKQGARISTIHAASVCSFLSGKGITGHTLTGGGASQGPNIYIYIYIYIYHLEKGKAGIGPWILPRVAPEPPGTPLVLFPGPCSQDFVIGYSRSMKILKPGFASKGSLPPNLGGLRAPEPPRRIGGNAGDLLGNTEETCFATREGPAWQHSRDLLGNTGETCMATQDGPRGQGPGPRARDQGPGARSQGPGARDREAE